MSTDFAAIDTTRFQRANWAILKTELAHATLAISVPDNLMTVQRVSYSLDSSLDSVNKAEEEATKMAMRSGFDEDEAGRISMAVREATVNAVLHGNHYDPNKRVSISFENTGQELVITVQDQGKGLKPENVPDPLAPENLLKQSGRGIFLIKAFMDEVRFRNLEPGTEITLIKRVHEDHKEASQ